MIVSDCGNCGLVESKTPANPKSGECQCLRVTDYTLRDIHQRGVIRQARQQLGILDLLSMYPFLRLDLVRDPEMREHLRQLATWAHNKLSTLKTPPPGLGPKPGPVCEGCDGTGVIVIDDGIQVAMPCDCELGEQAARGETPT